MRGIPGEEAARGVPGRGPARTGSHGADASAGTSVKLGAFRAFTTAPSPVPRGSEAASMSPSARTRTAWIFAVGWRVGDEDVVAAALELGPGLGGEGVGLRLQAVGEPLVVEARTVERGLERVAVRDAG